MAVSFLKNMVRNSFAKEGYEISASGLMGSLTLFIGLLESLVIVGFYMFNRSESSTIVSLMQESITIIFLGATLLGIRKVSSAIPNSRISQAVNEHTESEIKE